MFRLDGIYSLIENGRYEKAKKIINSTIRLFDNLVVNEVARDVQDLAIKNLYYALVNLAIKNYLEAYQNINNIHSML